MGNLTITPERLKQVDFTEPTGRNVVEIVVTGPSAEPIATVEDLSGKEVYLRKSSSYYQSIQTLNAELAKAKKAPVKVRLAPDGERRPRQGDHCREVPEKHKMGEGSDVIGGRQRFQQTITLFRKYGDRYDFDHLLLMAQGYQESQLRQEARSPVGAIGVMQVMPATGKDMKVGDITEASPTSTPGSSSFAP